MVTDCVAADDHLLYDDIVVAGKLGKLLFRDKNPVGKDEPNTEPGIGATGDNPVRPMSRRRDFRRDLRRRDFRRDFRRRDFRRDFRE